MVIPENIFADIPHQLDAEKFDVLLQQPGVRIERIVSTGQCSPHDFWYDQDEHEWVMVLQGRGVLEFEDGAQVVLQQGDYLFIPAHQKHRVQETSAEQPTVWLALFFPA